jgi:hypothetical protein
MLDGLSNSGDRHLRGEKHASSEPVPLASIPPALNSNKHRKREARVHRDCSTACEAGRRTSPATSSSTARCPGAPGSSAFSWTEARASSTPIPIYIGRRPSSTPGWRRWPVTAAPCRCSAVRLRSPQARSPPGPSELEHNTTGFSPSIPARRDRRRKLRSHRRLWPNSSRVAPQAVQACFR